MRKAMLGGLLAVGVVATPARALEQAAIDQAIEKGVAYLKSMQKEDGSWPHPEMGATALAGLALLECGVPADDKAVVMATKYVREKAPTCTHTYSLSLGLLFLDRLGDPGDIPLIDSLALRLMAGQMPALRMSGYPQIADSRLWTNPVDR